jgi:hypothetical protein
MARWWFVAVIGLALAGCGSSEPGAFTAEQIADLRADLDRQLENASSVQRSVFLDGVVERSEIQVLGEVASGCSVANGSSRIRLNIGERGVGWQLSFDDDADTDALAAISENCWDEHMGLAEQYYGRGAVPIEGEQVRLNEFVADCLAGEGFKATGWPLTDSRIDPSVEAECAELAVNS